MSAQKRGKRKHSDDEDSDKDEGEALNYSDEEGGIRVDDIYVPPPPRALCSTTNTGPRLIITKISNEWFKSYANLQVVGPFHKCFNAIVGPNGSGKSNVIDSLLFVFGYRASKIRSKKLSALLHNSESYQSILSCTVSVYFAEIIDKEGDAYDVIPNSEFVIARTANKDNSSFYQLNGRRVQFKEVAVLLRKHGVDLDHNRFLILQGEVEQIALMKCKAANEHETGMLEYLEDIIGTTRYKEPLLKLYDRVEILTEQRSEKINRLKMVENELEELKGPMEEAVGFLELENTITKNKNILYQKNIYDIEEQTKSVDATKTKIEHKQKKLVDELHALGEQKKEKQAILEKDMHKYQSLEKKKEMLKEAFDKANKKDIELQASMQQLNKTRKKTKELLAEERQKLAGYESVPERNAGSIAECEAKEKELLKNKEKLEEEKTKLLSTLRKETQELQQQKESLQTELVGLKKLQDEARSAYQLAESELNIFVSNEEKEQEKLNVLREKHEAAQKTIQEYTAEIQQLQKKIPATEKSLKEANAELNAVKLEEAQVIAQIRSKRMSVEESRAAMQASRSRGRILDSLMQQKREGKCPGLFGRLGDLGAIDQKYDVAISTACGPLDNIVVDTVKTAQWCIEFLKENDIGRATFIALDKQEHLRARANSQIETPENVPRLFDLIRIQDERVKTAFYFGLRDTLVADHLDQASRIAYGARRYRVVTLGGDLIETTGTMSGGGRTVSRGRMGQSVAVTTTQPQDVQKLEDDLEQLEQHVRELRERQIKLEGQINVLQPELRQMKINFEKYTVEVQRLKEQVPMLAQQLKAQEAKAKSTKADPAKVKAMSAVVASKKEAFDESSANVASFQVEVDAVTKEINDKTSGKMKIMDKNINDVNKTIDKCKTEITRLNVAIKTAERNAKKSAEKIATMEQDIENAENNLRKMKEQREEIEEDGKQLLTCTKEVEDQLVAGGDQFEDLKEAVKELTKAENELKGEKIDVDQRLSAVKKTINDLKAQIHGWRVKLSQLKLQKILDATLEELVTFPPEELENQVLQQLQRELQANQEILKTVKPNLSAIDAYRKKQTQYVQRSKELDELSEKRNKMHDMHEMLRVKRKEEFLTGYNIIRKKLKEIYQMITLGGDADFELVDTYDPFTEGIQFNVRPPKKSWKNICNLSGGEKTLSSLALVFAIHYYKPSPLYVMDEIDAALDFKNVSIVGNYIKERTKNAQFIIISLRSNMFELCNYLIGIYKTFNCTKSVTIDPCAFGSSENDEEINNENQNPNVNANTNPVVEADTISNVNNVVANYTSGNDSNTLGGAPRTILVTANVHQSAPENDTVGSTPKTILVNANVHQSAPEHPEDDSVGGNSKTILVTANVLQSAPENPEDDSVGGTPKMILVTANVHQSAPENPEDDNVSSLGARTEDSMDDVVVDDSFHSSTNSMEVD